MSDYQCDECGACGWAAKKREPGSHAEWCSLFVAPYRGSRCYTHNIQARTDRVVYGYVSQEVIANAFSHLARRMGNIESEMSAAKLFGMTEGEVENLLGMLDFIESGINAY